MSRQARPPRSSLDVDGPKMLRIGVMQGARIIEERIIHTRQSVSVGQSARSTFILAHPSLPAHHVLFESRRTGYVLNARPFMAGRLTTREGVTLLEGDTLRTSRIGFGIAGIIDVVTVVLAIVNAFVPIIRVSE